MPDSGRFSDRDVERELRDLGARIEHPPTPDLARAVRHRLDAEEGRRTPTGGFWRSLLSPRWAVPAAALVLILFAALSPAVRGTFSNLFVYGQAASSGAGGGAQAGGPAARPESGGSAARSEQQAEAGSEDPRASVAGGSQGEARPESGGGGSVASQSSLAESAGSASAEAGATGCPSPSLEAEPARAAPGAAFRLHGSGFTSGCESIRPAQGIRIDFRQPGKTWRLTSVDAGRNLAFDTKLRVPEGAMPGRATVRATIRPGESVEKRFVVLR